MQSGRWSLGLRPPANGRLMPEQLASQLEPGRVGEQGIPRTNIWLLCSGKPGIKTVCPAEKVRSWSVERPPRRLMRWWCPVRISNMRQIFSHCRLEPLLLHLNFSAGLRTWGLWIHLNYSYLEIHFRKDRLQAEDLPLLHLIATPEKLLCIIRIFSNHPKVSD